MRVDVYRAEEVYVEEFERGLNENLYTDQGLLDWLVSTEQWSQADEDLLTRFPRDIEEFKVGIFQAHLQENKQRTLRKAMGVARLKLSELQARRHAFDPLSASGAASLARARYLLGASLADAGGNRLLPAEAFWESCGEIVNKAAAAYEGVRLCEAEYRELARTEPWHSTWRLGKNEGSVFGVPPVDYTEEQRSLAWWSRLYESVYEQQDCPPEDVINDDDALDGWLILRRRERDKSSLAKQVESSIGSEKIRSADHVFLPVDGLDGARKVESLNDPMAASVKKQRLDHMRKHGQVEEQHMPDSRQKQRMLAAQAMSAKAKGVAGGSAG